MTDKTDKIRERLIEIPRFPKNEVDASEHIGTLKGALEAVVEELPLQCRCGDHGKGVTCNACKNINLIADELDVEKE